MKTPFIKTLSLLVFFTLLAFSCKKDDATPPVSDDEAANAVGDMLASDFTGSATDAAVVSTSDAAHAGGRIASGGRTEASSCGVSKDTTITHTNASGALITFTRTAEYLFTLDCADMIPDSITLNFTGSSTRTGVVLSAAGESAGKFKLGGFKAGTADYTLNGTFDRTETITENTGSKSFTGLHSLVVTNVLIDKSTYAVKGGSATYTMTGTFGPTVYTHSGTITFLGDGSATIVVNGNNYKVDLLTGTVTKS